MHPFRAQRADLTLTSLAAIGAVSAGVHAGLAPAHLHEWAPLGASFIAAALASSLLVAALILRRASRLPRALLGALLGSLVLAYALTRIVALPPLDPAREPLDTLGVLTCAVELVGVLLALPSLPRPKPHHTSTSLSPTGGTA
jgi:hypothetical protein